MSAMAVAGLSFETAVHREKENHHINTLPQQLAKCLTVGAQARSSPARSGVRPDASLTFMFAPAVARSFTTSVWPSAAAMNTAVWPLGARVFTYSMKTPEAAVKA